MTPIVTLVRASRSEHITLGVLSFDFGGSYGALPQIVTLENPWKENKRCVSSIPVGTYRAYRKVSPTFGETFGVDDVKDREYILFHWGNREKDTKGCILAGMTYGVLEGEPAVLNSRIAFIKFMDTLKELMILSFG